MCGFFVGRVGIQYEKQYIYIQINELNPSKSFIKRVKFDGFDLKYCGIMGQSESKNEKKNKAIIWWLLGGAVVLWIAGLYFAPWLSDRCWGPTNTGSMDNASKLGDSTAIINTLFSVLALAGVIYSIILQSRELVDTRKEMEKQREEFETQNDTLSRQRFESTFFNMLHLQQEITNSLSCNKPEAKILAKGREVFEFFYKEKNCESIKASYAGLKKFLQEDGCAAYAELTDIQMFDHYFRHLYRIIKYVYTSKLIPEEEKYEYVCILRAMLSPYELLMLFYNGLCHPQFKKMIEEYALFNNIRFEELANGEQDSALYDSRAYDHPKHPQANI